MPDQPRGPRFLPIILASLLGTGMLVLVVVLVQGGTAGAEGLETFADPIRAGGKVSVAVGGPEADALTQALRESTAVSVTNFQAQAGTGCFWADLGAVSAIFEMRESGGNWEVVHASLTRECECPDSADEPCQLH